MYSSYHSKNFVKIGNKILPIENIALVDCKEIENLIVNIKLKTGEEIIAEDIHALELVMQLKPSILEGKRLLWPKFVWFIHNVFAHPLTQILALLKCYRLAFWIHDVTVPRPLGKKNKKNPKEKQ